MNNVIVTVADFYRRARIAAAERGTRIISAR